VTQISGQSPQKSAARSTNPVVVGEPESMTVKKSA
jgi:hypothetical protein